MARDAEDAEVVRDRQTVQQRRSSGSSFSSRSRLSSLIPSYRCWRGLFHRQLDRVEDADRSWRNRHEAGPTQLTQGNQAVKANSEMLIGQPATVSTTRYTARSSGRYRSSHKRNAARTLWPTNQTADVMTNARRNSREARTLGWNGVQALGIQRQQRPTEHRRAEEGDAVDHVLERRPPEIQRLILRDDARRGFDAREAEGRGAEDVGPVRPCGSARRTPPPTRSGR